MSLKNKAKFVAAIVLLTACSAPAPDQSTALEPCGLEPGQIGQFVTVPSGSFIKGAAAVYPEEEPSIRLQVEAFEIQIHEVTNAQFEAFVEATGYVTQIEQYRAEGRADAGTAVFAHPDTANGNLQAWRLDPEANWRHPDGEGSTIEDRMAHPVIHVSLHDAKAYATWAGGRLANEVEWEYAANLGLPDPTEPTSGAYSGDRPTANTWQGIFPIADSGKDGFRGTAPVGCFESDRLGLSDMIGNVWEWTDTPYGPGTHTLKGGSFLCADNYCRRYRPAARHPQESDFAASHIGFRIVRDIPKQDPT